MKARFVRYTFVRRFAVAATLAARPSLAAGCTPSAAERFSFSALSRACLLFVVGATSLLAISQSVVAQTLWSASSGDWATGSNWVGGNVPTGGIVAIANGGTATVGTAGTYGNYDEIYSGDGNLGTGGTFTPGTVIQQGGTTVNVNNWFEIGRLFVYNNGGAVVSAASNTSSYTLNGNAVLNNGGQAEIGWGWTNGNGLNNTTGILTLNDSSSFQQNGDLSLAVADLGGVGILNLNNSATIRTNDIRVGRSGNGIFNQNGGVATVNGWLRIAENTGSTGVYNLNAGTMNANLAFRCTEGGSGTLNIASGAVLNVLGDNMTMTDTFDSEAPGNAVVNQNGGTVNLSHELWVGQGGGGTAVYNMNGGVLTVKSWLAVARGGATGTVNMTAGTINCLAANNGGNLIIGAQGGLGVWNMNGGVLTNNSNIVLGENSQSGTFYLNNTGLAQATAITTYGAGTGYFYFNGGTLQASASNNNFTPATNTSLYVQAGGAYIDTNGKSILVGNPLVSDPALFGVGIDGGLHKKGAGTLALAGNDSYTGATTVNAGTLLLTGIKSNTGSITINSGASLGTDTVIPSVIVASGGTMTVGYTATNSSAIGNAQPANLTTSAGAILAFKLSNTASTGTNAVGSDQINVAGDLSLANGTVINISQLLNNSLSSGTYVLINAPSNTTPVGSLLVTGLPLTRQTHTPSSSLTEVALVVAGSAGNLVWAGSSSNNSWDLDTTKNWLNTGNGNQRDYFYTLDNVAFTDAGAANGSVVLNGALLPGSVTLTMANTASAYSFSGTGSITGSTGLVMNGVGSLTVNTSNSYTGETDIHGGNVVINSGGVLGDTSGLNATYIGGPSAGGSASVAVHSGGTLSGTSLVLGYASGSTGALTQNGGVVNALTGNLVVGNSGAGTVTQSGGVVNVSNWLRLGEWSGGTGVANVSGGTLNVGPRAYIGEMGGGTLNLSGNAVMNVGSDVELGMPVDNLYPATPVTGVLNVSGNAVLNIAREIGVGRGGGSGLVTIGGNASVTTGFNIDIGDSNNNSVSPNINYGTSSGTLIQTGGTLTTTSGAQIYVGQYDNAGETGRTGVNTGVYNFTGGVANLSNWLIVGNAGGSGVMNIGGSAVLNTSSEVHIGDGVGGAAASSGTLNVYPGAVMNVNNWFVVGRNSAVGLMNMTGGSITQQSNGNFDVGTGNGAIATLNQSGGTMNIFGGLLVPEFGDTTTNGTYNLSGSGVLITNNWLAVGRDGGNGYFNFSGGTLTHPNDNGSHITIGSGGAGVFTMTGGLLVDSAASAFVGENSSGTLNISGGAAHFQALVFGLNPQSGPIGGTVNLTDGLLSTTQMFLNNLGNTGTLRLAGGTLQAASGAQRNFMSGLTAAYLDSGTTTIDTNSQSITIGQPLLAGTGSGGLRKVGAGMLTLTGQSTYAGPTVISAGTLQLVGGSVIGVTHRWNFDTTGYSDAVGGVTAIPSGNATLGAGGVTITGGGSSHVNYVSLGNGSTNILPTTNAPYTIQVWATENAFENWSRMFDFGSTPGGNSNLQWAWTQGTNPPGLVAAGPLGATNPYSISTGTEYNMSLVVYPNGPGSIVQWYQMDTAGNVLGAGSAATSWNISQLTQANMWLGRSEYGDNDADATYQNVSIYNGALSPSQIVALNLAGPDASLASIVPILTTAATSVLPTATPVTLAPNATLDLNGGIQQIASLNDATPGHGGTVINSDTAALSILTLSPTGTATFSGTISGGTLDGDIRLVVNGPGTQVLSGTNSYTGGTTVLDGTLILTNPEAIADGTSLTVGDPAAFAAPVVPTQAPVAAIAPVPEPGTLGLLAAGVAAAALAYRRARRGGLARK